MKISVISAILFFVIFKIVKSDDTDKSIEECNNELLKYQDCIMLNSFSGINPSKICEAFSKEECTNIVNDANNINSACNIKDSEVTVTYNMISSMKILYLMFCVKGTDGKICPVSQYLIDNFSKFQENDQNIKLTKEEETKYIVNDCKDKLCNERMNSIINFTETIPSLKNDTENINVLVKDFITNYKEKKCDIDTSNATSFKRTTISFIAFIFISLFILL